MKTTVSEFVKRTPPRPASVEFRDGCRLRWSDTELMHVEIVRCGGKWIYSSVDQGNEDEGCFAGDDTGCADNIYAAEFLTGYWMEF